MPADWPTGARLRHPAADGRDMSPLGQPDQDLLEELSQQVDNAWGAANALRVMVKAAGDEVDARVIALNWLAVELPLLLAEARNSVETAQLRLRRAKEAG